MNINKIFFYHGDGFCRTVHALYYKNRPLGIYNEPLGSCSQWLKVVLFGFIFITGISVEIVVLFILHFHWKYKIIRKMMQF